MFYGCEGKMKKRLQSGKRDHEPAVCLMGCWFSVRPIATTKNNDGNQ